MAQAVSTSITRRGVVAGLTLIAAPMAALAGADNAHAQAKPTTSGFSRASSEEVRSHASARCPVEQPCSFR